MKRWLSALGVVATLIVMSSCTDDGVSSSVPAQYTVSFDAQGGTPPPEATVVDSGTTVSEPTQPQKDGYSFGGWATSAGTTWDFGTDMVVAEMTLVAQWTATPVDQQGVVWNIEYGKLTGYTLANDSIVGENESFMESFDSKSLLALQDKLFVGMSGGRVMTVDVADHSNLINGIPVAVPAESNADINLLDRGTDALWGIEQLTNFGARAVRFSPDGSSFIDSLRLTAPQRQVTGLVAVDDAAWVLLEDPLLLVKLQGTPLAAVDTIALGQNPDDAGAPRGVFNGNGVLAVLGTTAWVADNTSKMLLKIDLLSGTIASKFDVSSINQGLEMQLVVSDWGLFVTDGISAAYTLYKIDQSSGAVLDSYTVTDPDNEGIYRMVLKQQRLVITEGSSATGMNNIVELDTETMGELGDTGSHIYSSLTAIEP
jgi:uncharacterized repeat protein (TIGR02543 family)